MVATSGGPSENSPWLTILLDALDESGEYDRLISSLVDLVVDKLDEVMINFVVTTRPDPALVSPLRRSHWKGEVASVRDARRSAHRGSDRFATPSC